MQHLTKITNFGQPRNWDSDSQGCPSHSDNELIMNELRASFLFHWRMAQLTWHASDRSWRFQEVQWWWWLDHVLCLVAVWLAYLVGPPVSGEISAFVVRIQITEALIMNDRLTGNSPVLLLVRDNRLSTRLGRRFISVHWARVQGREKLIYNTPGWYEPICHDLLSSTKLSQAAYSDLCPDHAFAFSVYIANTVQYGSDILLYWTIIFSCSISDSGNSFHYITRTCIK